MKFGQYAILQPVVHFFEKEPSWNWSIKPVTTFEEMALQQFLATERVMVFPDGSRIGRPATNIEVAVREIALSFAGTNITNADDELILEPSASVDEVEAVLKTMPHDMVMEIWKAVKEAVPGWGPSMPKVIDAAKK